MALYFGSRDDTSCLASRSHMSFVVGANEDVCEYPLRCYLCPFTTTQPKELSRHEGDAHRGQYLCLHPGCNRIYWCSYRLKKHSRKRRHRISAQFSHERTSNSRVGRSTNEPAISTMNATAVASTNSVSGDAAHSRNEATIMAISSITLCEYHHFLQLHCLLFQMAVDRRGTHWMFVMTAEYGDWQCLSAHLH